MAYDPRDHGALCHLCPLEGCAVVPPEANSGATIAVVGEAPGEQEEKIGRPFVGPSGAEFDRAVRAAGARRNDFHVTNAICCRPPDNDLKKLNTKISRYNKKELETAKEEGREPKLLALPVECCAPRLTGEIARFDKFITLGGVATAAITGNHGSILALRGGLQELSRRTKAARDAFEIEVPEASALLSKKAWNDAFDKWQKENGYMMTVMPTVHPAFVLRQQRWAHVFRNDVAKAVRAFKGIRGWAPPKVMYNPPPSVLAEFLSDKDKIYTFDIEADGIESLTAHIRCIAIGDEQEAMVVGFRSNTRPRDQDGLFLDFYSELDSFYLTAILTQFFTDKDIVKVGHNCLFTGTPVLLGSGESHPIEDLVRRKYTGTVLAMNRAGELVEARVTDWFYNKVKDQDWIVIRREGEKKHSRGLTLTPDHEVYTTRGRVRADEVRVGDYILSAWPEFSGFPGASKREPLPVRVESVQTWIPSRSTPRQKHAADSRWCIQTTEGNFMTGFGLVKNCGMYDRLVLRSQMGIDPEPVFDTILLHRNVESELPHSLAYVASLYTDAPAWKSDREGNKLALGGETDLELAEYCAKDVSITASCFHPLLEQVKLRDQVTVWKSDQRMQLICADMHMVGMYVDQKKRQAEEKKLLALRHTLLEEIRKRTGLKDFNPGSIYHMRDLLFKRWGLESHLAATDLKEEDLETSSGDLSTGDLILRTILTLRTVPDERRDIVKLIRRFRKVMKILGTYVVKLRPWNMGADLGWDEDDDWVTTEMRKKYGEVKRGIVDPATGRMHPGYNPQVAVTGRLSSSKPINAQNFPVSQRGMIVAQPGHVLVGADMDQLELRIAAALWNVDLYLRAFREGKDPHSMTAYAVFGDAFCKAAGLSPEAFQKPGVLVGAAYDEHGVFQKGVSKEAKSMRDLSKAVQYASVSSEVKVALLDSRRAVPICEVNRGDWTWAWSTKNLRYEPARVKHVWPHGEKECVRVTFSWNTAKNGETRTDSVVVTADHPMLMRSGVLRHAGSLFPGDRLMPFHRDDAEDGYSYLNPGNNGVRVGEHRVVKGFYEAGERQKHVHHKNGKRRDNRPSNLEVLDHLDHYREHKDAIDAGRVNSPAWRAAVSDAKTRSGASIKAWEGRRERQDTDKTFGPRGSVLDSVKSQIGVKTDVEVATAVGCTPELVGMYRKAHGIAPPVGQKGWLRWLLTNDVLWNRLLHDNTDVEMARLVNEHFGVEATRDAVHQTRKLLGIPAVKKGRAEVYPRRASKLDAFADRVGHERDSVIAKEAGCTPEAVGMYRKKHGIPAYWKEALGGNNHTVVSIESVGVREVWDIEVEHDDHNFALAAGIFVHNSQYMASVETVHQLIQKTELPATDPNTGKALDDGTTDLPYAKLPLKRVREMRDAWLKGAPEFESGWNKEIDEFRRQGHLRDPVAGRRRDFLDGEEPNQIVNFKVQGGAAGLMNKAIIQLYEEIPANKWGPGTGIINQCHDSIAVECPEEEAEKVAKLMEECMNQEHPALPGVKFSASAVIGKSWKDV